MTLETIRSAREPRRRIGSLRECVEDRPTLWVNGSDVNNVPVRNPGERSLISEIDRARSLRRGLLSLRTGFGKNQRLRRVTNSQFPQQGTKIALALVEMEAGGTMREALLQ